MKRLMYFSICLCAMFVVMTSFTAKAENELIGEWEQVMYQDGVESVTTYDFREDGKLYQTLVMKCDGPLIDIKGAGKCEYTYVDGVITFKFSGKDVHFSKFEVEGVPEEMVAMVMEQMKSSMVDVEQELTDVKIKGDKLTARVNGIEITMTRM